MSFFSTTFVSLVAGLAAASPITDGWTLESREIFATQEKLENIGFFTEWAAAAYCNDDGTPSQAITCPSSDGVSADVCPTLISHNATVYGSFSDDTSTAMEGMVGVDHTRKEIVLALKGSGSYRNWITDVDLLLVSSCADLGGSNDCRLHQGFHAAWKNIAYDATTFTQQALAENPGYRIIVTGHSLGAAVANIAAAYLRQTAGLVVDLYTYGSPRVGNQEFVNVLGDWTKGDNYRVTHIDDPFPRMPPNSWVLGSYRHVSPEYWVTQPEGTLDATLDQLTVCEGNNNDACNSGQSGQNNTAHLWYFGGIAGCAPASITW